MFSKDMNRDELALQLDKIETHCHTRKQAATILRVYNKGKLVFEQLDRTKISGKADAVIAPKIGLIETVRDVIATNPYVMAYWYEPVLWDDQHEAVLKDVADADIKVKVYAVAIHNDMTKLDSSALETMVLAFEDKADMMLFTLRFHKADLGLMPAAIDIWSNSTPQGKYARKYAKPF